MRSLRSHETSKRRTTRLTGSSLRYSSGPLHSPHRPTRYHPECFWRSSMVRRTEASSMPLTECSSPPGRKSICPAPSSCVRPSAVKAALPSRHWTVISPELSCHPTEERKDRGASVLGPEEYVLPQRHPRQDASAP